jgi:transcription antitermination factor NusG
VDGVFADFSGKLTEISADGNEITVVVSSLGRDMPIKLDMKQIRKKAD